METSEIRDIIEEIHKQDINQGNAEKLKAVFEYVKSNYSDFSSDQVMLGQVLQTYLKIHVCPVVIVYWDEAIEAPNVSSGTGVLLNLEDKFLVTNRHVIEFYRHKKREKAEGVDNPIIQVGAVKINLDNALIDENETLDIATIKLTDEDLSIISATSYKEFLVPDNSNKKKKISSLVFN